LKSKKLLDYCWSQMNTDYWKIIEWIKK
jgi:hypothetical protein